MTEAEGCGRRKIECCLSMGRDLNLTAQDHLGR